MARATSRPITNKFEGCSAYQRATDRINARPILDRRIAAAERAAVETRVEIIGDLSRSIGDIDKQPTFQITFSLPPYLITIADYNGNAACR